MPPQPWVPSSTLPPPPTAVTSRASQATKKRAGARRPCWSLCLSYCYKSLNSLKPRYVGPNSCHCKCALLLTDTLTLSVRLHASGVRLFLPGTGSALPETVCERRLFERCQKPHVPKLSSRVRLVADMLLGSMGQPYTLVHPVSALYSPNLRLTSAKLTSSLLTAPALPE